ncbi:nucleotide pyrophosphohydrolase [soil metagenome]
MTPDNDIAALQRQLREFAQRRDWEQYHTPKNLAMALATEVGELLEHFQWLTPEQSIAAMVEPDKMRAIVDEIADVTIYLTRLADVIGVDLLGAAAAKMDENEHRFPPSAGSTTDRDQVAQSADRVT